MTGQVRGRRPAEHGMPAAAKPTDVEITQARNLGIECVAVRQRRTDLHARRGARQPGAWIAARCRSCGFLRAFLS